MSIARFFENMIEINGVLLGIKGYLK